MVEIHTTLTLIPSNKELIGSHIGIVVHCCIDMLGVAITPIQIIET